MKWSWKIGKIAGIDLLMHSTFPLLLAWVALTHLMQGHGLMSTVQGLLFILILFGIVVLHELGHALTARRFGIHTRDITLLPIGGVARLERMPEEPRQELLVALAGPAVNVVLAGVLLAAMPVAAALSLSSSGSQQLSFGSTLLGQLLWVNVGLALFNLIPAFPMDGGRVLRALLATRMDYVRATRIAARVGQTIAFLFGGIGLFVNPFLLFIALFVWIGAAQEASMIQMKSTLRGIPVSRVMVTHFRVLSPQDTLEQVAEHVLSGFQQDFPVVGKGGLVGNLTRADLLRALAKHDGRLPVGDVMLHEPEAVGPLDRLEDVFVRLRSSSQGRSLPVIRDGQLVGLVAMEHLIEFMTLQSALSRTPSDNRPGPLPRFTEPS